MSKEIDARIAEKIFNYEWWRSTDTGRRGIFAPGMLPSSEWNKADGSEELYPGWNVMLPSYSTQVADTLEAAARLAEKKSLSFNLRYWDCRPAQSQWIASFTNTRTGKDWIVYDLDCATAIVNAICEVLDAEVKR